MFFAIQHIFLFVSAKEINTRILVCFGFVVVKCISSSILVSILMFINIIFLPVIAKAFFSRICLFHFLYYCQSLPSPEPPNFHFPLPNHYRERNSLTSINGKRKDTFRLLEVSCSFSFEIMLCVVLIGGRI